MRIGHDQSGQSASPVAAIQSNREGESSSGETKVAVAEETEFLTKPMSESSVASVSLTDLERKQPQSEQVASVSESVIADADAATSDTSSADNPVADNPATHDTAKAAPGSGQPSPELPESKSIASNPTAVATASATVDERDELLVTQAISEQSESNELANAVNLTIETTNAELSEKELVSQLLARLSEANADESEAERSSRLIKLRHMMVLAGDPDGAVVEIDGMAEAEQEYLRHHLLGLWTMIDPEGHPVPSRRFSSAIPQIREAAR